MREESRSVAVASSFCLVPMDVERRKTRTQGGREGGGDCLFSSCFSYAMDDDQRRRRQFRISNV